MTAIILATFLTAFYTFRLFVTTFLKQYAGNTWLLYQIHESMALMIFPLLLLFCGSIFIGYLYSDFFIGFGNVFLSFGLVVFPYSSFLFETDLL